jgi:hypothetical protein
LLIGIPLLVFVMKLFPAPILWGDLPFGLNSRAAAVTMQTDRSDAGWALMNAAVPASGEKAAAGFNLVTDNQSTLTACWTAANTQGRDQRCTITVGKS